MASCAYKNKTGLPFLFSFCLKFFNKLSENVGEALRRTEALRRKRRRRRKEKKKKKKRFTFREDGRLAFEHQILLFSISSAAPARQKLTSTSDEAEIRSFLSSPSLLSADPRLKPLITSHQAWPQHCCFICGKDFCTFKKKKKPLLFFLTTFVLYWK